MLLINSSVIKCHKICFSVSGLKLYEVDYKTKQNKKGKKQTNKQREFLKAARIGAFKIW